VPRGHPHQSTADCGRCVHWSPGLSGLMAPLPDDEVRTRSFSSSVAACRAVATAVGWQSYGDCGRKERCAYFHPLWWPLGQMLLWWIMRLETGELMTLHGVFRVERWEMRPVLSVSSCLLGSRGGVPDCLVRRDNRYRGDGTETFLAYARRDDARVADLLAIDPLHVPVLP